MSDSTPSTPTSPLPDSGDTTLEADAQTPTTETAPQANGELSAEATEPEAAASEPEPEAGATEPEAAVTEPEAAVTEPELEAAATEPEPEAEATEPEAEATEPEAAVTEPELEAAATEPEAAVTEPEPEPDATESEGAVTEPEPVAEATEPAGESTEPAAVPVPRPMPMAPRPPAPAPQRPTPSPAVMPTATPVKVSDSTKFGRVAEDGTVYVRTPEGEKEVGSFPGATPEEALAYFARKFDDANAQADLLIARITQTDLSAKDASDGLGKLREVTTDLRAVGDLVALMAKVETIATAVDARRTLETAERAAAREAAVAARELVVAEAEKIAAQDEAHIQWKASSARMHELLEEWKEAQRKGPRPDREAEQALWHRLSAARNSLDKMRRVHFARLSATQGEAKSAKEDLVKQAEALATSTEWGATAGAFKRLMDQWRHAGRASRQDDEALWKRFKTAQDSFFAAKDKVASAENEHFAENLAVKEKLLTEAQALLPIKNLAEAKASLRKIQDKWDAAGKVPRADIERIEKAMRRVETAVREAEDKKWVVGNPEVKARANSMVTQLESALASLQDDLAKAEATGNAGKVAKLKDELKTKQAWLDQARRSL